RNSEKFINYSIYNIQTGNVSIKDGKATGVVDYDWGGSLVEGGKKEGGHLARSVHLAKEEDTWKITYIGPLVPETQ
ncbi:MAG: hypothetical protein PHP10_00715, partial [Candidatus Omnitrophica bacterium]|nr:hypothetical protein [Candidatus Omnitrophota bacterium]